MAGIDEEKINAGILLSVPDDGGCCFPINWARFGQRMNFYNFFKRLAISAPIFVKVRSEPAPSL